ncbi:TMF-regulated nuclear protein 1-like [Pseudorasbora parva]|uniref:TMF-regulated nuclear protein 1-like n=1 Tax=Pseudorasbora parva TaxID=51549 RepID=UPI00351E8C33
MERLTGSKTVLELSLPRRRRQHKQNSMSTSHLDRKQMQQPCANMKKHQHEDENSDSDAEQDLSLPSAMDVHPSSSSNLLLPSCSQRRSISMGDFRRVPAGQTGSEPPSTATTAPSSKLVTPSSSMEFEAARRRLLEVEERQRVIREMERRLEELREVFVRSEQEAVEHGELVARITAAAQQGELYVAENGQRLKKGLRFKRHKPTIVFSSMLGLRTCLPWPVKLK